MVVVEASALALLSRLSPGLFAAARCGICTLPTGSDLRIRLGHRRAAAQLDYIARVRGLFCGPLS